MNAQRITLSGIIAGLVTLIINEIVSFINIGGFQNPTARTLFNLWIFGFFLNLILSLTRDNPQMANVVRLLNDFLTNLEVRRKP
jgi:hypothetical protein